MGTVSLQFHGTKAEVAAWVAAWARELGLSVAVERFFPDYVVQTVVPDRLEGSGRFMEAVDRVSLSRRGFDVDVTSLYDFLEKNGDILTILVENAGSNGLRESMLSASSNDEETISLWRKLRGKAQKSMLKGADVVGPTGIVDAAPRSYRYTVGARELARQGTRLLAIAGDVEYRPYDIGSK